MLKPSQSAIQITVVMSLTMFEQLQQFQQQFADHPVAQRKINAALATYLGLAQRQLPNDPLPTLSFSVHQLVNQPALMALETLLADFRQALITTYGIWHLPNNRWLDDLHDFVAGRPVLEIMAGNGVISHGLRARGDDVVATDNFVWSGQDNQRPDPWTTVIPCAADQALRNYPHAVVIMSWAPDTDNSDLAVLQALRQARFAGDFIVIGEKMQATNSPAFWATAQLTVPPLLNHHHHSFDNIHDQVYLVK